MSTSGNPFTRERLRQLAYRFPPGASWESFLEKLAAQEYCAAIVGSLGSGKTTLLEGLPPHLEALGFEPILFRLEGDVSMREKERLPERLREVKRPGFILLDGAEQLSTRHWLPIRSAASTAAGFVVTVHRTSRLPTAFECETSVSLLQSLVEELAGASLPRDEAETLLARKHGNLRAIFDDLHDRWSGVETTAA